MREARLEEIVEFDEEGRVEGFQFEGRERAIQEWRDKKEEEEYEKLFKKLYHRNYARKQRQDEEKREQANQRKRQWRAEHRAQMRKRLRELRKSKYEANPVINQCEECGKLWSPPYEKRSKKQSRFCSKKCRNAYHGKRRNRPTTGKVDSGLTRKILTFLKRREGATSEEITRGVKGKKPSVLTTISRLVKQGMIASTRVRPAIYSIQQGRSEG